ncbi:MAG TPA: MFS transporter [Alphaproteobacteria bacterium]
MATIGAAVGGAAAGSAAAGSDRRITARIERLPLSAWHFKIGVVIGSGWFFDAFDALAIAYALPVLIGLWKLAPGQIGLLISIPYAGQIVGSIFFGWLAERIGRVPCTIYTLLVFSVMSLVCAYAWSFESMLVFRFVQGLGLGGEIPIMATYISEFASARRRGRFTLTYQLLFVVGLVAVAAIGRPVVQGWGWQALFFIGAVPALLVLPFRRLLPESPRWLASRGRYDEADRVLTAIEDEVSQHGAKKLPPLPADVPPVPPARTRVGDLFKGIYLRRTVSVWIIWFCVFFITYGLVVWVPSLYRTVYRVSVDDALHYGFVTSFAGLIGALLSTLLIDRLGRKPIMAISQLASAVPLLVLATQPQMAVADVVALVAISFGFNNMNSIMLSMYTAELYPTELRALGCGIGNAWLRFASVIGPLMVGAILPVAGLQAVFVVFGIAAVIGGLVAWVLAVETRGKALEVLSPSLST